MFDYLLQCCRHTHVYTCVVTRDHLRWSGYRRDPHTTMMRMMEVIIW